MAWPGVERNCSGSQDGKLCKRMLTPPRVSRNVESPEIGKHYQRARYDKRLPAFYIFLNNFIFICICTYMYCALIVYTYVHAFHSVLAMNEYKQFEIFPHVGVDTRGV